MGNNDFSEIEREIKEAVENVFQSIHFSSIRSNIDSTAKKTIDQVEYQIKDTSNYVGKKIKEAAKKCCENSGVNKQGCYISKKPVGRYSGIIYVTVGTTGVIVFGVSLLVSSAVLGVFKNGISSGGILVQSMISILLAANAGLIACGAKINNRLKRFKKYSDCIGDKNYSTIEELAKSVTKRDKFVVKDLEKMVELDMFKEAHFDDEEEYFILGDEIYSEYLRTKKAVEEKKQKAINTGNNEVDSTIEFVRSYIDQINRENTLISDSTMTSKLNNLEKILSEIFKYISKNPQKISEVRKLTNQYLPITLKLVTSYKELNNTLIQGENVRKAKAEIEKSIDLINLAFEKLLDNLFEDVALDISSDISVLETLFSQEGLTKNDFKK